MQKRHSLLFLLTLIGLIPLAFFLSLHDLTNVMEFMIGIAWFLGTIFSSLGFWKLRRTSQEKWAILVLGSFSLIFALSFLADVANAPAQLAPLPHLIFAIILGILGFLCFYIAEMIILTSIRFFLLSFRSTSDPKPLSSHLYQTTLFRTCGEALLLPFRRK